MGDRTLTAGTFLGAAFSLGVALQSANGHLHSGAMVWLTLALALTVVGVVAREPGWLSTNAEGAIVAVVGIGLAWQFYKLLTAAPGVYLHVQPGTDWLKPFYGGLAVCAVLSGGALAKKPWLGALHMPLLFAAFTVVGQWLLTASPEPLIDVFVFQRDGAAALLSGHNPFELRYPNIYSDPSFYGSGLSENGVLAFGYPYLPLSLLLALPGHVLFGDYRYSQLGAMVLAAALMAYARPGRWGRVAATLMLFTPRVLFVLEQGWSDPFVTCLLAALVFAACRSSRLVPWLFGLFLAVKQYLVFALPAAWLLLPRPMPPAREVWRTAGKAVLVGALVTVPFFVWSPKDFWFDVVELQLQQPFRADALSYLALWARSHSGEQLPTSLAFVAGSVGVALGLWRQPRTPSGFAATLALAMLGFFAFNKQAFCNYYAFVIGALCVAVSALGEPEPT